MVNDIGKKLSSQNCLKISLWFNKLNTEFLKNVLNYLWNQILTAITVGVWTWMIQLTSCLPSCMQECNVKPALLTPRKRTYWIWLQACQPCKLLNLVISAKKLEKPEDSVKNLEILPGHFSCSNEFKEHFKQVFFYFK